MLFFINCQGKKTESADEKQESIYKVGENIKAFALSEGKVCSLDITNGGFSVIPFSDSSIEKFSLSPNGKFIALIANNKLSIYALDNPSEAIFKETEGDINYYKWIDTDAFLYNLEKANDEALDCLYTINKGREVQEGKDAAGKYATVFSGDLSRKIILDEKARLFYGTPDSDGGVSFEGQALIETPYDFNISYDGKYVVFTSQPDEDGANTICIYNLENDSIEQVAKAKGGNLQFSPYDNSIITYTEIDSEGKPVQLVVLNTKTKEKDALTDQDLIISDGDNPIVNWIDPTLFLIGANDGLKIYHIEAKNLAAFLDNMSNLQTIINQ